MTTWQEKKAAEKSLFTSLMDVQDIYSFLEYPSPSLEASLFKGVPNTEDNRHTFLDMFRDMKKLGHFKGKRIKLVYRGPRDKTKRGSYNAQSYALQSEGTTFAVYLYEIRFKPTSNLIKQSHLAHLYA